MSARRILVLGNLKGAATAALEGAAKQTDTYLTFYSRADEGIRDLDHREWRAILVDITTPGASRFCHEARARRALFNVPLVGMTPQLTDLAFANAFRWGADDVVALGSSTPIVQRIQALPAAAPIPQAARGEAVVADGERARCDVLGRVLANAGYSVRYATDLVSARYYLSKPSVTLFVLNEELGSPAALLEEAHTLRCGAKWVIAAKQRRLKGVRDALKRFKGVAVMSSHGAPENVLFALNFLEPSHAALRRAQVRALHGTMVLFRGEGEEDDECGYTYSISANGLYVRTLLPPPSGQLWLELEPAGAARRVRLLGEVAWSRTFGQSGAETAPPGFGVKLVSGLGGDLDTWVAGFNRLEGAHPDSHTVPEVKLTPQPFRVPLPAALSKRPERRFSEALGASGNSHEASPESQPIPALNAPESTAGYTPTSTSGNQDDRATQPVATTPSIELALQALSQMPAVHATKETLAEVNTKDVDLPASSMSSSSGNATALSTTQPIPIQTTAAIAQPSAPSDAAVLQPGVPQLAEEAPLATAFGDALEKIDSASSAVAPKKPQVDPSLPYEPVVPAVVQLQNEKLIDPGVPLREFGSSRKAPAHTESFADLPRPEPEEGFLDKPTPTPSIPSGGTHATPVDASGDAGSGHFNTVGGASVPAVPLKPAGTTSKILLASLAAALLVGGLLWLGNRRARDTTEAGTSASTVVAAPQKASPTAVRDEFVSDVAPAASPPAPEEDPADFEVEPEPREVPLQGTEGSRPVEPPPSPPNLSELDDDEVWLLVRSRTTAHVFVHGIDLGQTNEWHRSKCGMRFIRLGHEPGRWLSEGSAHKLPCQTTFAIDVEATFHAP